MAAPRGSVVTRLQLLWIGPRGDEEFVRCAELAMASAEVQFAADCAQAVAQASISIPPELIVLCQRWPGACSESDIAGLKNAYPLAGMWCIRGDWGGGVRRAERTPPGPVPLLVHEWPARWSWQLERRRRGLPQAWGLPLTASDVERYAAALPQRAPSVGRILVVSEALASGEALAAALQAPGNTVVVKGSAGAAELTPFDVVVVDAPGQRTSCEVQQIRQTARAARWVVLQGFPRSGDRATLAAAGIRVVAKPFLLTDLYAAISACED